MGGVINLVSRKPTKSFESEFRGGVNTGDGSGIEAWNAYAMVGTRQEHYYAQGSINVVDRDYFTLSNDYAPTPTSLQQGRVRVNSDSHDLRFNAKFGFTPNDTDEYAFNYTRQDGTKGGLLNVYNNPPAPANGFWRWPRWDIESVSVLTNTKLDDTTYLKTKFYLNTFTNDLQAFDNISFTTIAATGRFISYYSDHTYGGSVEVGTETLPQNELKVALHFRNDKHSEYNDNRPDSPTARTVEPIQHQEQETVSVALQDTYHVAPTTDVVMGINYEHYAVKKAEEFATAGGIFSYPLGGANAFNWQGAVLHHFSDTGEIHFSISDRARFPNIFELYSTQFSTAIPNPNLGPERATNYELGAKETLFGRAHVEAAFFYNDISDLIQTVQVGTLAALLLNRQNVGNGHFYGFEVALDVSVNDTLYVGGNFTRTARKITDSSNPNLRPTGVPTNKAFLYASWRPSADLTVTPSVDLASDRWSDRITVPAQAFPYIRVGNYELVNLQVEYAVTESLSLAIGGKNLFDQNIELSWGLPQQGRNFYAKGRVNF